MTKLESIINYLNNKHSEAYREKYNNLYIHDFVYFSFNYNCGTYKCKNCALEVTFRFCNGLLSFKCSSRGDSIPTCEEEIMDNAIE